MVARCLFEQLYDQLGPERTQEAMENNPNMVDSLFVPDRCVLHTTKIGTLVREQRRLFLHKGSYHKFRGYSYSQRAKMQIKDPDPESKRYALVQQHGYDTKTSFTKLATCVTLQRKRLLGTFSLRVWKSFTEA